MAIHWTTVLDTAPTIEPVSLAEARTHMRIDDDVHAEDSWIERRIKTAREYAETFLHRQLITATWELILDSFPAGGRVIRLPYPPAQSVTSIEYYDTDGDEQTWDSGEYRVDSDSEPGRSTEAYGYSYPSTRIMTGAVTITYKAGYGDTADDVPGEVRDAIEILVAHWHEIREPIGPTAFLGKVPMSVESLLWHHRALRFDGPTD